MSPGELLPSDLTLPSKRTLCYPKKRFRSDAQIRHQKQRSLRQCGMQIDRHGGNSYSRHSPGSEDETHRDIADTALLIQTGRAAKKCSSSGG